MRRSLSTGHRDVDLPHPSPLPGGEARSREFAAALACCTALAFALGGPALTGRGTLWGADMGLDSDPLYATSPPPAALAFSDPTPAQVDVPRDLAIAGAMGLGTCRCGTRSRHAARRCGPSRAGPFFPLKLPFYLLPSLSTTSCFSACA